MDEQTMEVYVGIYNYGGRPEAIDQNDIDSGMRRVYNYGEVQNMMVQNVEKMALEGSALKPEDLHYCLCEKKTMETSTGTREYYDPCYGGDFSEMDPYENFGKGVLLNLARLADRTDAHIIKAVLEKSGYTDPEKIDELFANAEHQFIESARIASDRRQGKI